MNNITVRNITVRNIFNTFKKKIKENNPKYIQKIQPIKQKFIKNIDLIIKNANNQSVMYLKQNDKIKIYYFNDKKIVETGRNYNIIKLFTDIKGSISEQIFYDIINDNWELCNYEHILNASISTKYQNGGAFNPLKSDGDEIDDIYKPFNLHNLLEIDPRTYLICGIIAKSAYDPSLQPLYVVKQSESTTGESVYTMKKCLVHQEVGRSCIYSKGQLSYTQQISSKPKIINNVKIYNLPIYNVNSSSTPIIILLWDSNESMGCHNLIISALNAKDICEKCNITPPPDEHFRDISDLSKLKLPVTDNFTEENINNIGKLRYILAYDKKLNKFILGIRGTDFGGDSAVANWGINIQFALNAVRNYWASKQMEISAYDKIDDHIRILHEEKQKIYNYLNNLISNIIIELNIVSEIFACGININIFNMLNISISSLSALFTGIFYNDLIQFNLKKLYNFILDTNTSVDLNFMNGQLKIILHTIIFNMCDQITMIIKNINETNNLLPSFLINYDNIQSDKANNPSLNIVNDTDPVTLNTEGMFVYNGVYVVPHFCNWQDTQSEPVAATTYARRAMSLIGSMFSKTSTVSEPKLSRDIWQKRFAVRLTYNIIINYQETINNIVDIITKYIKHNYLHDSLIYSDNIIANCKRLIHYLGKKPNEDLYITGHSLGGGMTQYLSATHDNFGIAFNPVGTKIAISALNLTESDTCIIQYNDSFMAQFARSIADKILPLLVTNYTVQKSDLHIFETYSSTMPSIDTTLTELIRDTIEVTMPEISIDSFKEGEYKCMNLVVTQDLIHRIKFTTDINKIHNGNLYVLSLHDNINKYISSYYYKSSLDLESDFVKSMMSNVLMKPYNKSLLYTQIIQEFKHVSNNVIMFHGMNGMLLFIIKILYGLIDLTNINNNLNSYSTIIDNNSVILFDKRILPMINALYKISTPVIAEDAASGVADHGKAMPPRLTASQPRVLPQYDEPKMSIINIIKRKCEISDDIFIRSNALIDKLISDYNESKLSTSRLFTKENIREFMTKLLSDGSNSTAAAGGTDVVICNLDDDTIKNILAVLLSFSTKTGGGKNKHKYIKYLYKINKLKNH